MRICSTGGRALQRVQLLVRGFLPRRAALQIACSPHSWLPRHLCWNPPRPFAPAVQAQDRGNLRHQRADADGDGHLSRKVQSGCKCSSRCPAGDFRNSPSPLLSVLQMGLVGETLTWLLRGRELKKAWTLSTSPVALGTHTRAGPTGGAAGHSCEPAPSCQIHLQGFSG